MAEMRETQKRTLGRGLGSLLGDDIVEGFRKGHATSLPSKRPEPVIAQPAANPNDPNRVWQIDVEKVFANPTQPRRTFDPVKLKELSESVREKGIIQPILVKRMGADKFEIIAGERRWRAAQQAGLEKVPVLIKDIKPQEGLELALIENIQRHDLNPIEEAQAYRQLHDVFGLNQEQIAIKVSKERATIANLLRLLALDTEVQQMIIRGDISTGHAKVILGVSDHQRQRYLAKKVIAEKLTVRATEKMIQDAQRQESGVKPQLEVDVKSKLVKGLGEELSKTLGTKVEINYHGGRGQINITYYSDDDLTRIIEMIKKK